MQANGGTLVDNSEEGLYQGMQQLLNGEIKPMHVDYEAYNQENVRAFEALFEACPSA
jgi:CDP-glycerol glycerophosphotransferase